MVEDLGAQGPEAPGVQIPDSVGSSFKEGINPPEQKISTEILKSPNYGRFFNDTYFNARLGNKDNAVDPRKIDMAAIEQDALRDYNAWLKDQTSKERIEQEETRRGQLEGEFFSSLIYGKDGRGARLPNLPLSKPYTNEYRANIEGTSLGDSPLCILESYGISANNSLYSPKELGAPPLDEIESFAVRFSQIREELEKDTPDLKKVDTLLAEFLHDRLKHFFNTIDQRIERAAKLGYTSGETLEQRKELLQRHIYDTMHLDVDQELRRARTTMGSEGYKARTLALIGESILPKTHVLSIMGNPFKGDNFSSEPEKQEEHQIRQQAAEQYRKT